MRTPTTITNDQMFKRVFGRDKELCRRLIELALGEPIESVEYLEPHKESRNLTRPGGAYFDVLATTASGQLVDVEMQATSHGGLPQRAQLYLGRLAMEGWSRHIETHDDYDFTELPRVAVIFVCKFDPFGAGLRRYTWRMRCDNTGDAVDGAVAIYLNANGSGDDVDADLAAFLSYVASNRHEPGASRFVDAVAGEVARANADPEFLEGLMDLREKLWISKQEGLEQGAKRDRRQISELAARMAADGRQDELAEVLMDESLLEQELRRYGLSSED